ncbi:RNA-directed DNA polymerase from transposon BS [Paramuricea clavata]|uniref:RNA-directed DNA polymerase from transposon BS n=1 Tax=Paramuricea clavata TaxID=317549 RepID=A0A6S7J7W0_PARCT|nr:RNA-directed DNA polymerase from transposon BS [Paramuricea clavata]
MKHLDEIRLILNNNALDILAINESKIDNQISNNEIHIDGFNIIRKDRNRFGGGVVLYVRQNISFSDRIDLIPDELEMVCIELSLPYNKSLLISTWYRPPNSLMNKFDYWASFLAKCDNEDKELILIGDLNCDVSKTIPDPHTCKLQFLCSLYQIDQLIKESTRLTPKSATLIDLILTNRPENISRSGVIHLGISDHSLVYAVRKFTLPNGRQKIRQVRNFKNFVENDFIRDVSQLPWEMVYQFGDPNLCWQVWKSLLLDALNRHAPLRHKRIRNNPVPWINPQIKELMRKRDYHKKKAIKYDSESQWELYKTLRNEVNINMRKAKSKYFCDKIQASSQMGDSKSGWAWINSLLGRKHKNANINELKVNDDIISDDKSITETLNEYFINIGMKMAAESACQSTDALNDQVIYESTVLLPKENFHFADITIDSVSKRLQKLNVSKATGALIQMCDQWLQDMDEGKINGVVFLDICKAFDSVNHEILLEKLKTQFGIHDIELKWFQSYLRNRKQVCSVNDQTSSARTIICGIPQGSILGPLLFLLYINDMPDILERTTPCLYADDTQISSSSHDYDTLIDNLNMDLSSIHKWLAKNKLKYHRKKTKVIFNEDLKVLDLNDDYDLSVLIDKYENTLKETLQQHAPQKRRIITLRHLPPWYNEEIGQEKNKSQEARAPLARIWIMY